MNKTNLLLSTTVGMAFIVAGPAAIALGKKQQPHNGQKAHPSVSTAFLNAHGFKAPPPNQARKGAKHLKEQFMIETWGTTTVDLLGGTVAEDAANTVTCSKACTIVTLNTAEVLSYYSYNQVGICPVVDGYMTNGGCFFSGALSLKDLYRDETNQTNLSVGKGAHVVQTYLYTLAPAYLGHYQNDYHIYE